MEHYFQPIHSNSVDLPSTTGELAKVVPATAIKEAVDISSQESSSKGKKDKSTRNYR